MEKEFTLEQVLKKVRQRLKQLDKLDSLGYYAVFMGKVQVVEWLLKRLLTDECGWEYEKLERRALSGTIRELKIEGMREDYLYLLNDLNTYRNYFAHDYFADNFLVSQISEGKINLTKPMRELNKAHFAVEQVLVVYEWISENGSFWKTPRAKRRKK